MLNTIIQKIKNIGRYIQGLSRRSKIILGVLAAVLLVVLAHIATRSAPTPAVTPGISHVTLASVASLSAEGGPLPVTGKVVSVSKANILAVSSGEIVSLPHKLGDRVAAGTTLASFENSSQRAAVLQAQGSYDAALAARTAVSPVDASAAARNAYSAAYTTLDTLLHADVDTFFGDPTAYGPELLIDAPMYAYGELSRDRKSISDEMRTYRLSLAGASSADPAALLSYASAVTQKVSTFVTKLSVAANRRESRASDTQRAALDAARSGISSLAATIAGAQQSYRSASVTTTSSTDATITIALGGLRAAQAALEKTIVRAPISGTIVSLPVHRGDFVSPGSMIAALSNPGALQIEAYVTSADAKTLAVGGKAHMGGVSGTIVFIAPAIDPTTGKIQVTVGLPSTSVLADGDSVSVLLERAGGSKISTAPRAITIPIVAAKITPQGPVVFTVTNSVLAAHPIVFGAVRGGQVTVTAGLTSDLEIVTDARGLSDGQPVVVDPQ